MSQPGVRQQLEAAQGQQQPAPQPQGGQPQPGGGGLGELVQAFSRCEQTHQCSPADRQILTAGLPQLVKMAQAIQQILASSAGGAPGGAPQPQGQQPQGGQPPQPQGG